jgi:hypothetical protein
VLREWECHEEQNDAQRYYMMLKPIPVGRSNSPTFGHFKFPHPDERLMAQ